MAQEVSTVEPRIKAALPMSPSPPALLTAAANRQPLHHIIPAWMMGYLIPKSSVTLFCISAKSKQEHRLFTCIHRRNLPFGAQFVFHWVIPYFRNQG